MHFPPSIGWRSSLSFQPSQWIQRSTQALFRLWVSEVVQRAQQGLTAFAAQADNVCLMHGDLKSRLWQSMCLLPLYRISHLSTYLYSPSAPANSSEENTHRLLLDRLLIWFPPLVLYCFAAWWMKQQLHCMKWTWTSELMAFGCCVQEPGGQQTLHSLRTAELAEWLCFPVPACLAFHFYRHCRHFIV